MTLEDCIAAIILTFLATLWLLTTEAAPSILDDRSAAEREFVEVYYLTNAMCYFVGWAWVSCLRDLATLVARFGAWLASCLYMPLRVQDTGSYAGEILHARLWTWSHPLVDPRVLVELPLRSRMV